MTGPYLELRAQSPSYRRHVMDLIPAASGAVRPLYSSEVTTPSEPGSAGSTEFWAL